METLIANDTVEFVFIQAMIFSVFAHIYFLFYAVAILTEDRVNRKYRDDPNFVRYVICNGKIGMWYQYLCVTISRNGIRMEGLDDATINFDSLEYAKKARYHYVFFDAIELRSRDPETPLVVIAPARIDEVFTTITEAFERHQADQQNNHSLESEQTV